MRRSPREEDAQALEQLAVGTLKLAQLLGITTEDHRCCFRSVFEDFQECCERLGWRAACLDLPRMVDHTWLRCRLPKQVKMCSCKLFIKGFGRDFHAESHEFMSFEAGSSAEAAAAKGRHGDGQGATERGRGESA